jgi:hypothetical protein
LPNGPDFDCQAENGVTLLALFFIAKWPRFHLPKTRLKMEDRSAGYGTCSIFLLSIAGAATADMACFPAGNTGVTAGLARTTDFAASR